MMLTLSSQVQMHEDVMNHESIQLFSSGFMWTSILASQPSKNCLGSRVAKHPSGVFPRQVPSRKKWSCRSAWQKRPCRASTNGRANSFRGGMWIQLEPLGRFYGLDVSSCSQEAMRIYGKSEAVNGVGVVSWWRSNGAGNTRLPNARAAAAEEMRSLSKKGQEHQSKVHHWSFWIFCSWKQIVNTLQTDNGVTWRFRLNTSVYFSRLRNITPAKTDPTRRFCRSTSSSSRSERRNRVLKPGRSWRRRRLKRKPEEARTFSLLKYCSGRFLVWKGVSWEISIN